MRLVLLIVIVVLSFSISIDCGKTTVSISGTQFYINGKLSNDGTPAAGLLLNSKMSQAIFDDENTATAPLWNYPDTHSWNASRNTLEFIANVSLFNSTGLNAITVGLQGSDPDASGVHNQQCIVSAFTSIGGLKPDWAFRLTQVLKVADQNEMVVILTLFDINQEHRLAGGDSVIIAAVQSLVQFLVLQGSTNVIIDLADECSNDYTHQILTPNSIHTLISIIKYMAPHIPVSTSFPPGVIPPDAVIEGADFILLHATGLNHTGLSSTIATLRGQASYKKSPNPIVINQDSEDLGNLAQAVSENVSWGFYSQGLNNYNDGYCSPPVAWGINTINKKSFFQEVSLLTTQNSRHN